MYTSNRIRNSNISTKHRSPNPPTLNVTLKYTPNASIIPVFMQDYTFSLQVALYAHIPQNRKHHFGQRDIDSHAQLQIKPNDLFVLNRTSSRLARGTAVISPKQIKCARSRFLFAPICPSVRSPLTPAGKGESPFRPRIDTPIITLIWKR